MNEWKSLKGNLLAEQVEEQLMKYIQTKPVKIGEKIPNEFELGELFGVGRSTIREAVKSLATQGVLEVRRGSGTYVIDTVVHGEDPLGVRNSKDKVAIALDLVEVRMMIEPQVAALAALRATAEDVEKITGLCDLVEKQILGNETYIQADIAFHCCIAECSKNKIVEQLIPIIDTAVMMFVNVTHKKLTQETILTHRAICAAIARGDHIGAGNAMTMHLNYNREALLQLKQGSHQLHES